MRSLFGCRFSASVYLSECFICRAIPSSEERFRTNPVGRQLRSEIMDSNIIRLATLADLPLIDQLANEVLAEHGLPRDSAVAALDSNYFSGGGQVNKELARFWLAINDGEVIGSAAIVPQSGSICTFKTFYVKAAHRGNRIGYRLYSNAELFARSAQYRNVQLYVSRRFHKAIGFYVRNGYRLVEELNNVWEDSIYLKDL